MAPTVSPGSRFSSRAEDDNSFKATPVAAVVVPIVLLILLLTAAAIISMFSYWRKRNDPDRLIKASTPKASRKLLPDWLSNWMDSTKSKLNRPKSQAAGMRTPDPALSSLDHLPKHGASGLVDENDSDVIALRPISVYIPTYPLAVHEPYDRYADVGVRPKVFSVPFR